jgi:hypothetical protein
MSLGKKRKRVGGGLLEEKKGMEEGRGSEGNEGWI